MSNLKKNTDMVCHTFDRDYIRTFGKRKKEKKKKRKKKMRNKEKKKKR